MTQVILFCVVAYFGWRWWEGKGGRRMSLADARHLLDVSEDADAHTIGAAHRRLIARVHPDVGGSKELAARVNIARDLLLAELSRR